MVDEASCSDNPADRARRRAAPVVVVAVLVLIPGADPGQIPALGALLLAALAAWFGSK